MANTHAVIYIAANAEQAHMLKNALEERGIFAYVSNEALQIAGGDLPMGLSIAPRVIVDEHDAEEARQIALEFDRGSRGKPIESLDQLDDAAQVPVDWPECPHCRRRRQTSCPICETAGTNFPAAFLPDPELEAPDSGEQAKLWVLCPTCDEPFTPEFLARCEWCGHRFRDGREVAVTPVMTSPFEDVNSRVWIVIAGLLALLAATLATVMHLAPNP